MKLSELINKHIRNLDHSKASWVQRVKIQRENHMTLVYFEDYHDEMKDEADLEKVVWFNNSGEITMIEGRFSYSFYEKYNFKNLDVKILESITREEDIELDYGECAKIEGVRMSVSK